MANIDPNAIETFENVLREVDARCINEGVPILSVMARTDAGDISPVTLESIKKYGLAKPGETIERTLKRLFDMAHAYFAANPQMSDDDVNNMVEQAKRPN